MTVRRAGGKDLRTVTLSEPFAIHAGAYVRVRGIDGNTHLGSVSDGWDTSEAQRAEPFLSWSKRAYRAEEENQRLRTAMVHAMDNVELAAKNEPYWTSERKALQAIARRIKAALDKK